MEPSQPADPSRQMNNQVMSEAQEKLLRRLSRQIRSIKIMLGFFLVMILVMLAIVGFVAYKVVTFTREINGKIDSIQAKAASIENKASDSLNVKKQLCGSTTFKPLTSGNDICTQ